MGFQNLPVAAGGESITDFVPFWGWQGAFNVAVANTYEDLVNIAGKGYFSFAYASVSTAFKACTIKITVDGAVLFEGGQDGDEEIAGIFNFSQVKQYTSGARALMPVMPGIALLALSDFATTTLVQLPYTAAAATGVASVIYDSIPFAASLQIEIKSSDIAANLTYGFEGAYI